MPSSKSWIARHREGGIYSFVILLVAALVCGGVVAGANFAGRDAFAAADARLDEAKGGAQRALLFPDATFEQVSAPAIEGLNSVYRTDGGAWVFDVSATGYHGDVELMVGIAADGTVAGIQIVAEDETDGIGTNALTEEYFGTFAGMPAGGALTLEDAGSDQTHVDGVSGATFTSNAVVGCLNIAFEAYAQLGGN
ncbi:FMN-binding protein [Candidatus Collinsella stercoripullorum]|uniref:FMN-binding protein n=1 Tax=Candidatus Collinsella stercoripullorum TaxID=2838522 RepID=UPI0022DEF495|nr:FMN-binding protein [Candidatus Collinsella stercoripullorum]